MRRPLFNTESIYTPQMVVDGQRRVRRQRRRRRDPRDRARCGGAARIVALTVDDPGSSLTVKVTATELPPPGRGNRAEIIVAVTEDHLRSEVSAEKTTAACSPHGRRAPHAASASRRRRLRVGTSDIPVARRLETHALQIVAFVQEQRGRTILASAAVALSNARR